MEIISFFSDTSFNHDKVNVSAMTETEFTKEIRLVFSKGHEMKEHQTKFPIIVQVLQGEIEFSVADEGKFTLQQGDMIDLKGSVPHSLLANKDSIVRLTLAKLDEAYRVKQAAQ